MQTELGTLQDIKLAKDGAVDEIRNLIKNFDRTVTLSSINEIHNRLNSIEKKVQDIYDFMQVMKQVSVEQIGG